MEAEKPNPMIFLKACELLGVNPEDAVHVGDDRRNDIWGARDAGCDAWLWGSDVYSFNEVSYLHKLHCCLIAVVINLISGLPCHRHHHSKALSCLFGVGSVNSPSSFFWAKFSESNI